MSLNTTPRRPTILMILDGIGMNPSTQNNGYALADTPRLEEYFAKYPNTVIEASGRACGLPVGQMGNSEVGHLTLGCGHIVRQDLVRIDDAIADESFYDNAALINAVKVSVENHTPLHLVGLVSDGGVHSHINHLLALIELAKRHGAKPLVHMITDGRDTPPKNALNYLDEIEAALENAGGAIATVCGRYYAMDRDTRWERTEKAWKLMVWGDGEQANSAREAIETSYAAGVTDEFIEPVVLPAHETITLGSPVIFFNFRNDRPRQLAEALGQEDFAGFARVDYASAEVTCMTEYDPKFLSPIAFPQERPTVTLAQTIASAGLKQFHCAETEKYPHVTFFFNGGKETPFAGEDRVVVPSPDVATYDLKPEMSAPDVADETIKAIQSKEYGFIVVNFANGDMVGHTAVPEAIISAVETVDTQAGRVLDAAVEAGFSVILTADHGNCDEMIDGYTGEPHTQHTTYPVFCMVIDEQHWRLRTGGGLAHVAPTILTLMGLGVPEKMEGTLLLESLGAQS